MSKEETPAETFGIQPCTDYRTPFQIVRLNDGAIIGKYSSEWDARQAWLALSGLPPLICPSCNTRHRREQNCEKEPDLSTGRKD